MTLTILASVSLLSLVATARPIIPEAEIVNVSIDVQNTVQSVFQSRVGRLPGTASDNSDDVHVKVVSSDEQNEQLSQLDNEAVMAMVPLTAGDASTEEEKKLFEMLSKLHELDGGFSVWRPDEDMSSLSRLATPRVDLAELDSEATDAKQNEDSTSSGLPMMPHERTQSLLVIAFSCLLAILALSCVALTIYIGKKASQVLASKNTWQLLPRLEKQDGVFYAGPPQSPAVTGEKRLLDNESVEPVVVRRIDLFEELNDVAVDTDVLSPEKPQSFLLRVDPPQDNLLEEDKEENFHDALDLSPLLQTLELSAPSSETLVTQSDSASINAPDSIPRPRSPDRRSLQMRDVSLSPVSRPAWSLRASSSPSLGVIPTPDTPRASSALVFPRSRAYRAVPEFDIALAMQLRPGLGIGADPAWMVRFLMTMFGWFTVLLTNSR